MQLALEEFYFFFWTRAEAAAVFSALVLLGSAKTLPAALAAFFPVCRFDMWIMSPYTAPPISQSIIHRVGYAMGERHTSAWTRKQDDHAAAASPEWQESFARTPLHAQSAAAANASILLNDVRMSINA